MTETPVDSLRVGQYVCVSGDKRVVDGCAAGEPYRIIAIDLPFIALLNRRGAVDGIDTRVYALKRVSKRYWNVFVGTEYQEDEHNAFDKDTNADTSYPRCVRCGDRLVQRSMMGKWHYYCRQCDVSFDEVT